MNWWRLTKKVIIRRGPPQYQKLHKSSELLQRLTLKGCVQVKTSKVRCGKPMVLN